MARQAVAAFNDKYHDGEFADPALLDPREEAAKKKWMVKVWWPLLLASPFACEQSSHGLLQDQGLQLNLIQNTSTLKSLLEQPQYQNFLRTLRQEPQKYA